MRIFVLLLSLLGSAPCAEVSHFGHRRDVSSDIARVGTRDVQSNHVLTLFANLRSRRRRSYARTTPTISTSSGQDFVVGIEAGGQSFKVILDTGSSDLWLPVTDFQCYDVDTNASLPQSDCDFPARYNPGQSKTYQAIPNENFNISYGGAERLVGTVANESITLAGITVPRQTIGVVNSAAWEGDGISSGILGMAYPSVTSVYRGDNPSTDAPHHYTPYNNLFINMFEQGSIPPIFSITYNRGAQDGQQAGYLALGGLPPVQTVGPTAEVPIIDSPYDVYTNAFPNPYHGHELYSVTFDGITYGPGTNTSTTSTVTYRRPTHPPSSQNNTIVNSTSFIGYLDSGTSVLFLDPTVALAINNLFYPPAVFNSSTFYSDVPCDAIPPIISFKLGGVDLPIDSRDLIQPNLEGTDAEGNGCVTAVIGGAYPSTIGVPFYTNTVVVHDVDNSVVRVTERMAY